MENEDGTYTVRLYGGELFAELSGGSGLFDTYTEALDWASRKAAKEDREYTIYKAVAKVKTETPPVRVTEL